METGIRGSGLTGMCWLVRFLICFKMEVWLFANGNDPEGAVEVGEVGENEKIPRSTSLRRREDVGPDA